MSAAASTSTIELWASWEGHIVNGEYPLRRCLGSSDHSGVFLTESRRTASGDLAIKIVPAVEGQSESQLSRWRNAATLDHPNLVRIFETGDCQVDGRPYLYCVMEYADQDLAQLLQRRALTEDEAREMLGPALSGLSFLHDKRLAQGRVKPSNVLVVGDQLKLASDTVSRVGESVTASAASVYDPPEVHEVGRSAASDMWALGITICEALTRRQPFGLQGGSEGTVLPPELSPAFRELVAWCMSRRPSDRPEVPELEASLRGERTVPIPIPAVEPAAEGVAPTPVVAPSAATPASTPAVTPSTGAPVPTSVVAPSPPAPAPTSLDTPSVAAPVSAPVVAPGALVSQPGPATPQAIVVEPAAPSKAAAAPVAKPAVPDAVARPQPEAPVKTPSTVAAAPATTTASATAAASVPGREPVRAREQVPTSSSAAVARSASNAPATSATPPRPALEKGASRTARESKPLYAMWAISVAAVLAIAWVGVKVLSGPSGEPSAEPADVAVADASSEEPSSSVSSAGSEEPSAATPPAAASAAPPRRTSPPPAAATTESDIPSSEVHKVIPDVPQSARRTIRGRIRVSVRLIVEKDGTVFAALADNPGPSRYFERLAIDAAKKWTFAPASSEEQRLMLARFVFTRDGTTATATALH